MNIFTPMAISPINMESEATAKTDRIMKKQLLLELHSQGNATTSS